MQSLLVRWRFKSKRLSRKKIDSRFLFVCAIQILQEVEAHYNGMISDGFDSLCLPAVTCLMFRGNHFMLILPESCYTIDLIRKIRANEIVRKCE